MTIQQSPSDVRDLVAGNLDTLEGQNHALVARQQTEIQSALIVAKKFPRDEEASFLKLTKSCGRPSFADAASYSFPRGRETVSGPSVNLAREAARCWGNIRYGVDQLPTEDGMIHLEAWAMDLESGVKVTAQDRFRKLIPRKTRDGGTEWREPNERDLRELTNRRGALQLRNCILQLLPVDLIEEALYQCDVTLEKAAAGQLGESRETTIRKLLRAFDALSVSQEMIEAKLGHPVKDVGPEELVELRGIFTSIREGHTSREDHFALAKEPEPEAPADSEPSPTGSPVDDLEGLTRQLREGANPTAEGDSVVS